MNHQKNALAVRSAAGVMKFAAWLQNLPNKMTPPPFRLLQIGSAFWQSRALYVAANLDIASLLQEQTLDAADLAEGLGVDADALARLLRFLAAMGIFREVSPNSFANNTLSDHLRGDHPQSMRSMVLMHNSPLMSCPWYENLEQGIREGKPPFRLQHGEDLFERLEHDEAMNTLFSEAMDSVEALTGDSFVQDFAWEGFDRLIDLGGARGSKALAILQAHPQMNALVVDRPAVIAEAQTYWQENPRDGVDRMGFQSADLLKTVPAARGAGDIYLLCAVLHALDDESCIRVLGNIAQAISDTGACLAVMELLMPESQADLLSASFDLQMFMGTPGRERRLSEWKMLFDQAGLRLEEVVGLRSQGSILLGRVV